MDGRVHPALLARSCHPSRKRGRHRTILPLLWHAGSRRLVAPAILTLHWHVGRDGGALPASREPNRYVGMVARDLCAAVGSREEVHSVTLVWLSGWLCAGLEKSIEKSMDSTIHTP